MPAQTCVVVYDGVIALDVFGLFDALSMADEFVRQRDGVAYFNPVLCGTTLAPVVLANGVRVLPDVTLGAMTRHDTLVVPGCFVERTRAYGEVVEHLLESPHQGRCISICTGAFVLAGAGLLDGLCATTHWAYLELFAEMFPDVDVSTDALFVKQGHIWTSAGVSAGVDLALALIREEVGAQIALRVARMLVVQAQRPGAASQQSASLTFTPTENERFHELQYHVFSHVSEDLSVARLAGVMHMSPRHFARQCREHLGVTPGELVRRARVSAAHSLLECTDLGLEQIAARVGWSSAEVLRRHILKSFGVPPSMLRSVRFEEVT